MKYIGILFSLLGFGLHLRMMGFLFDADLAASFRPQWDAAPIENKLLLVGSMVLPFAFYGTCIAACLAKRRSWKLTIPALVIGVLAFFYFTQLHAVSPSIAKNSLWAAFFSYIPYSVKSRTETESSEINATEPTGR